MKLSIVTTLYKSEPYIEEFYRLIKHYAEKITTDYEMIFVNDGSPDNSLDVALKLMGNDEKIKIIDLSRNFGHYKAVITGISHAKGDYVFFIDIDLEEEPRLLETFWEEMQTHEDADVIMGVQEKRKGGWFERLSGSVFYNVFNFLSETKIVKNQIMARLMTRRYVDALCKQKDKVPVFMGICALVGFNSIIVPVKKKYRGATSYSLKRRFGAAVDLITSFSNLPLIYAFYLGLVIMTFSFVYIIYIIFEKIFHSSNVEGWTSLIASVWFLGGTILFFIGVVGIYLSKVFIEVKDRPYTIIKEIHEKIK